MRETILVQELYEAMDKVEKYCRKNWTMNTKLLPPIVFTLIKKELMIP